jgi:uncharacterized membrane protein
MQQWSGATPHPDDLEAYERILPGSAERILAMAELQAAHRRSLEDHVVKSGTAIARRGQVCGLVIGLAGMGAAVWMTALDAEVVGGVIGGGTLVSLVSVFVYGDQQQRRERRRRWQEAKGA